MKHRKPILPVLPTVLLCCIAVLASLYCTITAFHLSVNHLLLVGGTLLACLIWTLAFQLPHKKITLPVTLLLGLVLFYISLDTISAGAQAVCNEVFPILTRAYGWFANIVFPSAGGRAEVTIAFLFLGVVTVGLSLFGILQCNSCLLSAVVTLPAFFVSVAIINYPPATSAVLALIAALMLLVFTQAVRSTSPAAANRLGALLLIPLAVFFLLLGKLVPRENYQRKDFPDRLQAMFLDSASSTKTGHFQHTERSSQELARAGFVDLSTLGPLRPSPEPVLELTTQYDGQLYLRGGSLCSYDGVSWSEAGQSSSLIDDLLPYDGKFFPDSVTSYSVSIHEVAHHSVAYLPYYALEIPSLMTPVSDSYVENSAALQDYEVRFCVPDTDLSSAIDLFGSGDKKTYADYAHLAYTQLPLHTRDAMRQMNGDVLGASSITMDSTIIEVANAVANFYQTNGEYTLTPETMPEGEDFAVWFTESSMKGYCMHYATAATVMLRAMGIPARYVTGYSVAAKAGEIVSVTGLHAHAWVEYYIDGFGWVPLEVTPAGRQIEETTPSQDNPAPSQNPTTPSQTPTEETQTPISTDGTAPSPTTARHGWYWLLLLPAVVLFFVLRRWLVLRCRSRRMARVDREKQAEMLWHYTLRAFKVSSLPLQEDAEQIALRAKYSNHALSDAEFAALEAYCAEYRLQAYAALSPVRRFWARWVQIL